jgi:serine/threonine-protein kinase
MSRLADALGAGLAGRYEIARELGRGGMATVFLARDVAADRPVALKVLHAELASTVGADRFKRVIRVAGRLDHRHILGVLDSGEIAQGEGQAAGQLWFTMPYVEGESLYDRLQRERQLPAAEALRIALAVGEALGYAHAQGVVHRDVKPDNILLSGERVLVADFGVARAVSEVQEKLTQTGMIVGTPTYMSPEQASGDKQIDGRTDVFALGCVLYEMLAGEPPFTGPTPQAALVRRFMGPPRPIRAVVPGLTEAVERAILRSLARDPAERFADGSAFAAALAGRAEAAGPLDPTAANAGFAASGSARDSSSAPPVTAGDSAGESHGGGIAGRIARLFGRR